jgi:hypothetical protein
MFASLYGRHRPCDMFVSKGVAVTTGALNFYEMNVPKVSTFSHELADELVATRRAALAGAHRIEAAPFAEIISDFAPRGFRHYRHVGCNDFFVNTAPGRDPAAA